MHLQNLTESVAGGKPLLNLSLAARVAGSASFCCAPAVNSSETNAAVARTPAHTMVLAEFSLMSLVAGAVRKHSYRVWY